MGISIQAYTSQVGDIALDRDYKRYDLNLTETNSVRCPDPAKAEEMEHLIEQVKAEGDTIGGVITCVIKGCPIGLGEPEFDKLHAQLGSAMLSINAVKGFEYGEGFAGVSLRGSEQNDVFLSEEFFAEQSGKAERRVKSEEFPTESGAGAEGVAAANSKLYTLNSKLKTATNHSGGIQGGISNGQDIYFRVAFKPVATLLRPQETVDLEGNATTFTARGRHDPCVLPRAVPVVEAMAAMVILDAFLCHQAYKNR